jgi:hypothetical protein
MTRPLFPFKPAFPNPSISVSSDVPLTIANDSANSKGTVAVVGVNDNQCRVNLQVELNECSSLNSSSQNRPIMKVAIPFCLPQIIIKLASSRSHDQVPPPPPLPKGPKEAAPSTTHPRKRPPPPRKTLPPPTKHDGSNPPNHGRKRNLV